MLLERVENETHCLDIYIDQTPEDPRNWDNLGTMVCYHPLYVLGDVEPSDIAKFNPEHYDNFLQWMYEEVVIPNGGESSIIFLPLYLLDHSGLSIKTTPFRMPRDEGQVGFIYVTQETLDKENLSDKTDDEIRKLLKDEVTIYCRYLSGDVYGFTFYTKETCECCGTAIYTHKESCMGFYGTFKGMEEHLPDEGIKLLHQLKDRYWI